MKFLLPIFCFLSISMMSQNLLIKNPTFKGQFYGWDYGVHSKRKIERPIAKYEAISPGQDDNAALAVNIERSFARGQAHQVYLIQDRIKLKKNKNYKVTFFVKSTVPDDKIYVSVGSGSAANGSTLRREKMSFKGDGTWKKLTFKFTAKNWNKKKIVDFKNAAVFFGFNFREGEYQIDNIKVELDKK